ncbi:hypothetical protein SPKIRA_38080 (plasmid) [Sphingomonas paucimobilis]|nr:hypothetical protein SPKIRA_38080 [Sphingomonas paucimobilis]
MPGWIGSQAAADYRGFTHRRPNYRGFTHLSESTSGRRHAASDGEQSFSLWITDLNTRFSRKSDSGFHPPSLRGFTHHTIGVSPTESRGFTHRALSQTIENTSRNPLF